MSAMEFLGGVRGWDGTISTPKNLNSSRMAEGSFHSNEEFHLPMDDDTQHTVTAALNALEDSED